MAAQLTVNDEDELHSFHLSLLYLGLKEKVSVDKYWTVDLCTEILTDWTSKTY